MDITVSYDAPKGIPANPCISFSSAKDGVAQPMIKNIRKMEMSFCGTGFQVY